MTNADAARTEKHAAQLRVVQQTLERISERVVKCQGEVQRLQHDVDELLYEEGGRGVERPDPSLASGPGPRCEGTHGEETPPATHLVWKRTGTAPTARCQKCAWELIRTGREAGESPQAAPILAGPPCEGTACRKGRRRHATVRIVTEHNRAGTAYCETCAERARAVLEEQGTLHETAPAAPITRGTDQRAA